MRRRRRPELRRSGFVQGGEIEWHGTSVGAPDWSDASRLVAFRCVAPEDCSQSNLNRHAKTSADRGASWYRRACCPPCITHSIPASVRMRVRSDITSCII